MKKTPTELIALWESGERRAVVDAIVQDADDKHNAMHSAIRFSQRIGVEGTEHLLAHMRDAIAEIEEAKGPPPKDLRGLEIGAQENASDARGALGMAADGQRWLAETARDIILGKHGEIAEMLGDKDARALAHAPAYEWGPMVDAATCNVDTVLCTRLTARAAMEIIHTAGSAWSWWARHRGPFVVEVAEDDDTVRIAEGRVFAVDWQRGLKLSAKAGDIEALREIFCSEHDRGADTCDRLLQRAAFGEIRFG